MPVIDNNETKPVSFGWQLVGAEVYSPIGTSKEQQSMEFKYVPVVIIDGKTIQDTTRQPISVRRTLEQSAEEERTNSKGLKLNGLEFAEFIGLFGYGMLPQEILLQQAREEAMKKAMALPPPPTVTPPTLQPETSAEPQS